MVGVHNVKIYVGSLDWRELTICLNVSLSALSFFHQAPNSVLVALKKYLGKPAVQSSKAVWDSNVMLHVYGI